MDLSNTYSNKYLNFSMDYNISNPNSRLFTNNVNIYNKNQNKSNLSPIKKIEPNSNHNIIMPGNSNERLFQFKDEFAKIRNILTNDPLRNPNLKPQDCYELYGYPLLSEIENVPQFNNVFRQKYLIKTLSDNKYIYINAKQYHRILRRREIRKKLHNFIQNQYKLDKNKKYHHESRHNHAMNRERGKGGRFIGKKDKKFNKTSEDEKDEEDENEEAKEKNVEENSNENKNGDNPVKDKKVIFKNNKTKTNNKSKNEEELNGVKKKKRKYKS